MVKMIL